VARLSLGEAGRPCKIDQSYTLLIDLDGVMWLGSKPLWDNIEAVKMLSEKGYRILFLTNNSTRSRRSYSDRLRSLGVSADDGDIVTSGYLASMWLAQKQGASRVYALGEEGLVEELILAGHRVLAMDEWQYSDAVVVGLDRGISYPKLRAAGRALIKGSLFIATNTDHILPVEDGADPGAGCLVKALEVASGRNPDFIAGKPNPWVISYIADKLEIDRGRIAVVGDRVDTDMRLAAEAGVIGVLVLTGLAKTEDLKAISYRDIYVVKTLKELAWICI